MQKKIVQLKNLTKKFGDFTAVDNIELELSAGEIYGFLGPNGAGKTTTIKMLAGLLQPSRGEITICNKKLHEHPAWCKLLTGYIPDRPYLYEKLTGTEYLEFINSLYSPGEKRSLEKSARYLELFDLADWSDHLIEGYSHGMRQKLIMTSIFMLDQPLVIVDEPMVGLDPKSGRIVKELFKTKARQGTAILLSTHSMEIAEELCNRIGIIVHGRIVATGTIAELRERSDGTLEDIFLELTGAFELQELIQALRSPGPQAGERP
jgi:ABC-2 type transport system ATP-binding protein